MALSTLKRKAMNTEALQSVTDEKFVREAKQLLGYEVLEDALALRKAAEVLDKLGIHPFDSETVQKYKAEQAEAVKTRSRKTDRNGWVTETRTRGIWESHNLRGYKHEIPAFALVRAAAVKRELTKAKVDSDFQIEELRLHTTRSRREPRLIDPFMVLVVGETRIYIDVWNEPKFEGRRVK